MIVYVAGNFSYQIKAGGGLWQRELDLLRDCGATSRLISYAWLYASQAKRIADGYRSAGVTRLFLDSGAFSAHQSGTRISLARYCRVIDQMQPDTYAVLDVIGDQAASMRNLAVMERMGHRPLPVFTRGGDYGVLRELVARYGYLALGNLVGRGITKDRQRFLDRVFSIAPRETRFHGFGVTSVDLLLGYPFYSVDSSSALLSTALGAVAAYKDGKMTSKAASARTAHLSDQVMGGQRHWQRRAEAIRSYVRLESHVTKVWTERGITWEEPRDPVLGDQPVAR